MVRPLGVDKDKTGGGDVMAPLWERTGGSPPFLESGGNRGDRGSVVLKCRWKLMVVHACRYRVGTTFVVSIRDKSADHQK